jgi:hypothetical protein
MKILKYMVVLTIAINVFASCKSDKKEQPTQNLIKETNSVNVIEVIAKDFIFTVDSVIPSGWSTFKMKNVGLMEHFFFMTKLPDTITFDDYVNQVGMAFGKSWNAYKDGQVDKNGAYGILGANLPTWYANAKAMGGIGIISGGQTGITTMKLTPGNYVMECYIKAANGQFHSELGMINPITVSNEVTKMLPPKANVKISLTNNSIEIKGDVVVGNNIFAVHFNEHPEVGLGNDIHLIKMDENTNMDDVSFWMDWLNIGGLTPPAPAIFLGGAHEMPVGYIAYFNCNLEPGDYSFIAETPIGRFKTFSVK